MDKIEIMVNADDGEKSVGQKRNEILYTSNGRFISFVDDDDFICDKYVQWIVNCIEHSRRLDSIGFTGKYYIDGVPHMTFKHANAYGGNYRGSDMIQYRPCNHLNPVRTSIAQKIGFPDKNHGEDSDYSDRLLESKLIKTEMIIRPVLYHYYFSEEQSRTHRKEDSSF